MAADTPSPGSFRTTRWSLVLAAGREDPGRQRALDELCRLYWPAVYSLYRRSGHDVDTASDLTQGLFLHLIERDDLASADSERGRFRAWLRTCARHYAANRHRDEAAQHRGGGAVLLSLDFGGDDGDRRRELEPAELDTPDLAFDRQFARSLLDAVLDQLQAEFDERGRGAVFAGLRGYLEVGGGPGFAASAAALGMSEGAVKVAVHRIRARLRELLVLEVRQTLADPDDATDELGQLLEALGQPGGDP